MSSRAAEKLSDGSVRIVALKNNEPVGAWEFEKESVSIGRSKTADVRLDDAAISRLHCTIEARPNGVFVKDNGSRNGIWVTGRRVQEALISSRDEVVIEHYRIKAYLVWGNTVVNRFVDKSEVKTTARGDAARAAAAPATPAPVIPAKPVAKPAAPAAPAANQVVRVAARKPAAPVPAARPVLDETNVLPPPAAPVKRAAPRDERKGSVSKEMDEILADVRRPAKEQKRAPVVEREHRSERRHSAGLPAFYFDRDEDDEDEDEITLPPAFDFVEVLETSRTRKPIDGKAVIEVIRYRGELVLDVARVDRGGRYELPHGGTLVSYDGESARVDACEMSGELRGPKGAKALAGAATLRYGDVAKLEGDDGVGYLVRFTEPMAPNRNPELIAAAAAVAMVGSTGASIGLHVVFCLSMIVADLLKEEEPEWSDFATIEMEEPETIAMATPVPTPEPKPKATPPPPPQKLAKAPEKLSKKPVRQSQQPAGGADRTEAKVASAGVLGGLGGKNIRIDSKSPALAAVTNLDAIKSSGGKSGGFRVGALTGKVPGDVRMGRAGRANGTVDISTINGKDIAGQALGGFGGHAKKGGGKVKGVVTQVPTQNVGVQGSLDRAQIAAVVNRHINEIRHCYEKNLINDPSLSGKIQVEWTINPDGTVQAVKTKFSSMKGGDVTGCVAGRIRTWQFPRPKGNGYVIVNYPFMFDSVGF